MNLEEENTTNPNFKRKAMSILEENSNLFVFTRYGADKKYYHIKSEVEFDEFLNTRSSRECLTLFKNKFRIIKSEVVDDVFIKAVEEQIIQEKKIDWVIIGRNNDYPHWSAFVADERVCRSCRRSIRKRSYYNRRSELV